MKRVRSNLRGRFWKGVIAYGLVWCLVMNTSVPTLLALEATDIIGSSGADFTAWGDHTIIDTENGSIIDWSNFNTSSGQSVTFNQYDVLGGALDSTSAVLNRITSASATQFDGALAGNGRVFVVNPAGVVFGGGATVNVAQLVVSGLGMTNDAFDDALAGADMHFTDGSGTVENNGSIHAESIIVVGKKVINKGGLIADDGLIVVAAGEEVFIAQDGSSVVVNVSEGFYGDDTTADIVNQSGIRAHRGKVVLAAGDTFSRAINILGYIVAYEGSVEVQAARIEQRANMVVDATGSGDAGSITLTGIEEVHLGPGTLGLDRSTSANAGSEGNGGTITIESEGTVTIEDSHSVSARGGADSGDGGTVKITAEHFVIEGDIDASPQNPDYANGTLTIDPPGSVTVADGANLGAVDTIYGDDIETLSNGGTNLVVHVDDSITVQDVVDGITGGRGDIEFYTGDTGSINLIDPITDAPMHISTTRGSIGLHAGSGGVVAGDLETGDPDFVPGQIDVDTALGSGGPITVGNLAVREGQSSGVINVTADGELTVNGTVAVGRDSAIDNDVLGGNAEATVYLGSGDDMLLNDAVTADAHTTSPGDATASIRVFAGLNETVYGNAMIGGDLVATAQADDGTSYALVEVDTWGTILWGADADATAIGDSAEVLGVRETTHDEDPPDEADVIITEGGNIPVELIAFPDTGTDHMGNPVSGNVLDNDYDPDGYDIHVAEVVTGPEHGTLDIDLETGAFTYTPEAGYVGDDTFTYTATNEPPEPEIPDITDPVTVTISMTNDLPSPLDDTASTQVNEAVSGNVLTNDTDVNGDPLTVVLDGTAPLNGTVELSEDGSFTYTPDEGYVGEDTFTYDVTDGQLDGSDPVVVTGTVTITVEAAPTPPPPPPTPTPSISPVAPGLERRDIEYSGIPALAKWVAGELGIKESNIEIWMTNALASSRDIQPFETYERLRMAAVILMDSAGSHIQALTQVINEFASSTAPPTEEEMASIADAIARNAGADNHYGVAEEYLNALAEYISILNSEMGFSMNEAVEFVTAKYVDQLAVRGNPNVAAYVKSRLAEL